MDLDTAQREAVDRACESQSDFIITGTAGSGKTTLIKAIADRLSGERAPAILAPTGKAAARLKEATGYYAETIHRALNYDGHRFRRPIDLPHTVIVDESSMIDSWLFAKMLDYHPKRLILVGDVAQLPPVGKGQPFHDLVALLPESVATLTTCYRAQGAVHMAAQAIRSGTAPKPSMVSGGETWRMIETGNAYATTSIIKDWVDADQFDPTQDIILSPRYGETGGDGGDGGIHAINKAVRDIVNPSMDKWAIGDRVLNNKNNSDLDFWNGDLGTIVAIDSKGYPHIELDRHKCQDEIVDPVIASPAVLREVSHAYCVSVHKSQGSQFRRVFFVCLKSSYMMLTRELIYTAITRAKEGVCVLGQLAAFYGGLNKLCHKTTVIQQLAKGAAL